MAHGDYAIDLNELDAAIARQEDLTKHVKAQFTRLQNTTKWFDATKEPLKGKTFYYRALVSPDSGVRREKATTAATQEFPISQSFSYQELSVKLADIKFFQASKKYNVLEQKRTADGEYAVQELAMQAIGDVEADFAQQLNSSIHQPGSAQMATVTAIYDADGSAFSGAAGHAPAFIRIAGGSIGQFNKNEVLEVIDVGDGTTRNVIMKVHAVVYGSDGPLDGSDGKVADIGPGLLVEPCGIDGTVSTTAWNDTAVPAVGDYIARYGEFHATAASYRNIHGFPDLFDSTCNMFWDGEGNALDRDSPANQWTVPYVVRAAASGSEVAFDADVHLRELEDSIPFAAAVKGGRNKRALSPLKGITIKNSLVAITTPSIVNDAVADAKANLRFTANYAGTLEAAEKKKVFGSVGFDGIVYHSPSLGVIALQADAACRPYRMEIIEPNSFFYLTYPGMSGNVEWYSPNGKRFTMVTGDNGRHTYYVQGAAHTALALCNDQPQANMEIRGVKSSAE